MNKKYCSHGESAKTCKDCKWLKKHWNGFDIVNPLEGCFCKVCEIVRIFPNINIVERDEKNRNKRERKYEQ